MANAAMQFEIETERGAKIMRRINDRNEAQFRADEAEEREARRETARKHADACRRHGERYADSFEAHGQQTPPPVDGEFPGDYRRRLLQRLIDKLPEDARWADLEAAGLASDAIGPVEADVLEAAKREGEHPSPSMLPDDGTLIARHRVDDMGTRSTEFYGRESFIKSMGRPGKRVVAFHTPRGSVLCGGGFRPGQSVEGQRLGGGLWR